MENGKLPATKLYSRSRYYGQVAYCTMFDAAGGSRERVEKMLTIFARLVDTEDLNAVKEVNNDYYYCYGIIGMITKMKSS